MDEELRKRSICLTCNYTSECVHFKKATAPILFCEEYDAYTPPPEGEKTPTEGHRTKPPLRNNPREYKGLCVNCDHRRTCIHAAQEGGVWHCEEYQ
jgi:hypothetical protein